MDSEINDWELRINMLTAKWYCSWISLEIIGQWRNVRPSMVHNASSFYMKRTTLSFSLFLPFSLKLTISSFLFLSDLSKSCSQNVTRTAKPRKPVSLTRRRKMQLRPLGFCNPFPLAYALWKATKDTSNTHFVSYRDRMTDVNAVLQKPKN